MSESNKPRHSGEFIAGAVRFSHTAIRALGRRIERSKILVNEQMYSITDRNEDAQSLIHAARRVFFRNPNGGVTKIGMEYAATGSFFMRPGHAVLKKGGDEPMSMQMVFFDSISDSPAKIRPNKPTRASRQISTIHFERPTGYEHQTGEGVLETRLRRTTQTFEAPNGTAVERLRDLVDSGEMTDITDSFEEDIDRVLSPAEVKDVFKFLANTDPI